MKQVSLADCDRIERADLQRALSLHEKAAAELRSKLGLVLRETQTLAPHSIPQDGISRLRTDQIDRLYDRSVISVDERAAALKIRTIFEAMGRGLFPGAADRMVGTKSRGSFRHPLERMSNREFFIWSQEYKPWANGPAAKMSIDREAADSEGVSFNFRKSYLQVCYAVIVDNLGPSQLEDVWPIPRGKGVVARALKVGLSKWRHVEYDAAVDLEDLREDIIAAARAKIEAARPPSKRAKDLTTAQI